MAALPTGTITFLFTDIEGSTARWERHPRAMPDALARHDAILHQAIESHGGVIFKTVGDGICAAFARVPDALAAALDAQHIFQTMDWAATGLPPDEPLRVRMAVHTGAAELHDGDYIGPTLNRIARLLITGHGGQILLSRAAGELVGDALPPGVALRDLGEHQLRDLRRRERIFQIVAADLQAEFPRLRTDSPPAPAAAAQPPQLLATKLYAPPAHPNLVLRQRLIDRLRTGLRGKLTLIAAPAGFGKTTLLSEWIADCRLQIADDDETDPNLQSTIYKLQLPQVAWVSLDAADNDPPRFWSYVIAALDTLRPGVGARALALLRSLQPPPIEAVLTPLLNDLARQGSEVGGWEPGHVDAIPSDSRLAPLAPQILVLDDYHVIDASPIHRALVFLIEHLPPQLRLVIATRTDPPLPLTRLRARGELTELRAADLRFTLDEVSAFLCDTRGIALASDQIAALDAHTEGWIAGLQLAALAMRGRRDLDHFIAAFTGSNRFVVDYLADEVLDRLPAHLQSFLLQTAILDRMCGPLCDAVLGIDHAELNNEKSANKQSHAQLAQGQAYSQLILEELERSNLFLVAMDDERRWYRYHHLFAEVLRHRLVSGASPAAALALHRRAAEWFECQGLVGEAIQHTLIAGDVERAALLIEQVGASMATQGQVYTVLGWVNELPDQVIRTHPILCIIHAAMLMYTNHLPDAAARLSDAERCVRTDTPADQARGILGQVAVLRGNIARFVGDLRSCVALARQALDLLPETEVFAHAGPLMRIGRIGALVDATYDFLVSGDATADVEQRVRAVIATARAGISLFSTLRSITLLARLQIMQGRLRAAAATYAEAAQLVPGQSAFQTLVNSSAYYFGMGELLREWNDLDGAERHLAQGIELVRGTLTVDAPLAMRGFLTLTRLRQARGDLAGAGATMDEFVDLARQRNFAADLSARVGAARARLALAQGDLAAAAGWASSYAELRMKNEEWRRTPERVVLHSSFFIPHFSPEYRYEFEDLTLARVLMAQGTREPVGDQLHTALGLLELLLAAAEAAGRMGVAIEILTLRALALQAQSDLAGALVALERALALAEPEGYMRVFVDEGAPLAELLRAAQARGVAPDYVTKLLTAFPATMNDERGTMKEESAVHRSSFIVQPLVEPLSARELEVLRLLADGASNRDIAHTLILSVGTVKKHINNIFGKLGAQSRTQVIVKARELHLL
jgi:LuxR family transcriptional regulator, maltose regulon positive regulatory protein